MPCHLVHLAAALGRKFDRLFKKNTTSGEDEKIETSHEMNGDGLLHSLRAHFDYGSEKINNKDNEESRRRDKHCYTLFYGSPRHRQLVKRPADMGEAESHGAYTLDQHYLQAKEALRNCADLYRLFLECEKKVASGGMGYSGRNMTRRSMLDLT